MPQFRADADGPVFLGQQLEYVSPNLVETVYSEIEWDKHLPVETGDDPAVATMSYDIYTGAGMAEIFKGDGWNLPTVASSRERVSAKVFEIGIARKMTDVEIEQAALEAMRMRQMYGTTNYVAIDKAEENEAAQAVARAHNEIAIDGSAANGLLGLTNQPNISSYSAPVGESSSALWEQKTGPEIVADMLGVVSLVMTTAKNSAWFPNRFLLPLDKYLVASVKQMPGINESALSYFQRTNPMGTNLQIKSWQRLNGRGAGSTGLGFVYKYDEGVIAYRTPLAYRVATPPARAPYGWTWAHIGRTAGVVVKRPFAVAKIQGF